MTSETTSPLQWTHPVSSVGSRGVSVDREATPAEREQLKTDLDILSVDAFHARYKINTESGGGFRMTGDYTAKVTQACVVSLEPVPQSISETIAVSFFPPKRAPEPEEKERSVLDEPDIEILTGDTIEAGRVLFELLSAALDPYPRKGEAEFSWQDPKEKPGETEKLHPFAALSKLKPSN
jgi:hypothetical protein